MFDVLILIIILMTLWTFVPKVVREAIGMGMRSAIDQVGPLLAAAGRAIEPVIHRLIVGKPRELLPQRMLDTPPPVSAPKVDHNEADEADRQTADQVSGDARAGAALRLDRSKKAIVKALLLSGWTVSQIRGQLKGDNNVLSQEIMQVQKELDKPVAGVEYPSDVEARIKRELGIEKTQAA